MATVIDLRTEQPTEEVTPKGVDGFLLPHLEVCRRVAEAEGITMEQLVEAVEREEAGRRGAGKGGDEVAPAGAQRPSVAHQEPAAGADPAGKTGSGGSAKTGDLREHPQTPTPRRLSPEGVSPNGPMEEETTTKELSMIKWRQQVV